MNASNSFITCNFYTVALPGDEIFDFVKEEQISSEDFLPKCSNEDITFYDEDNTCCPCECDLDSLEEGEEATSSFVKISKKKTLNPKPKP